MASILRFLIASGLAVMSQHIHADPRVDAFRQRCERTLPATSIKVVTDPISPVMDFSKSMQDLTYSNNGSHVASPGKVIMGLVKAESTMNVSVGGNTLTSSQLGMTCVRPEITVHLSYADMTFYVAREFRRGTCGFSEIYNHEAKHVNTYHYYLNFAKTELQKKLDSMIGNRVYLNMDNASLERLRDGIAAQAKGYLEMVEAAQNKVDSPQEYERVANSCSGEVREILNGSMRNGI